MSTVVWRLEVEDTVHNWLPSDASDGLHERRYARWAARKPGGKRDQNARMVLTGEQVLGGYSCEVGDVLREQHRSLYDRHRKDLRI